MKFTLHLSLSSTPVSPAKPITPRFRVWDRTKLILSSRKVSLLGTEFRPVRRLETRTHSSLSFHYMRSLTSLNNLSPKIKPIRNPRVLSYLSTTFTGPLFHKKLQISQMWRYYANNLQLVCTLQWSTVLLLTQNFATRPSNLYESRSKATSNYRTYATFNTTKL